MFLDDDDDDNDDEEEDDYNDDAAAAMLRTEPRASPFSDLSRPGQAKSLLMAFAKNQRVPP